MPKLSTFDDFFNQATGPAYLTSADKVINDAQLRNYELLDRLTRDRAAVSIQGGTQIKDMVLLDDPNTAETYSPGDAATVTNVQGGTTILTDWRFTRVPISWTDAEILLNSGGSETSKESRFHQFKNLKNFKYQQGLTSLMNLLERNLCAGASAANQDTGNDPWSVFYSLTTDGLAPSGFSTVHNVNPTTKSVWRNQTATWSSAFDDTNGIIAAFDQMALLVRWKRPPNFQEYFTDSDLMRHVITTNREGRYTYSQALRAANDVTRAGAQDPHYNDPTYNGIPVVPVEGYDDQSTFTAAQPGFLWTNLNYFKFVFHRDRFMEKTEVLKFADKPDTSVVYVVCWGNLLNCSRQRSGYVSYSA